MKIFLSIFFCLMIVFAKAQDSNKCWIVNDSTRHYFLNRINYNAGELTLLKLKFQDEQGRLTFYSVFKYSLTKYVENVIGIQNELAENYITNALYNSVAFPAKDTVYLKRIKLDTSALNHIKMMGIKKVLKQYFNDNGQFKEVFSSDFPVVSSYMYDECIGILDINILPTYWLTLTNSCFR